MKLAGEVAVVTGAGRGIGRAIALAQAKDGAKVALLARARSEIEGVAARGDHEQRIRLAGRARGNAIVSMSA